MATSPAKPALHHVLAVPLPAQGHINPLMRFCKLLVSRRADVIVTFVNIDPVHHRIMELKGAAACEPGAADVERPRIRLAHVPLPTLGLGSDFRVSLEHFFEAQPAICPGLEGLIGRLNQEEGEPPVTCIISDMCMTTPTQLVADNLRLPRIALFPSSQCALLFDYYLVHGAVSTQEAVKMAQECDSSSFKEPAHVGKLEGLAPLQQRDLYCFKHVVDDNEYMYPFLVRECKITFERSNAIVVNSFMELEGDAIEAFIRKSTKAPLFVMGPLIEDLSNESSTNLWPEDEGCIAWLDKQPPNSVLYISFGSVTIISKEQFEEVLAGLELSNQRFLWALRPDLVEGTISSIPQDFLEKTSDRRYMATWAPQLLVLKHPSIGAFLTHCGWNSTIEGVSSGVPMLCWPYFADQFMDAKYIIEEWKVGLGFQDPSIGNNLIPRKEIERVIRAVMEGDEGKTLRKNAFRLKEAALKSHGVGGSLTSNIDALINGLQ